jgi:phosphopantothenate-cysteine ligase
MLKTRKQIVTFITQNSEKVLSLSPQESQDDVEIESKIIPELVRIHQNWIDKGHTE